MLPDYDIFISDPFYTESKQFMEEMRVGQIIKGADTYGVPFNPANHSSRELLTHAAQELVDAGHYMYGMGKALETLEAENARLKKDVAFLNEEIRRTCI